MPRRALLGVIALVAIAPDARPDALAALEDEQTALFDRVAPAVVVIRSGEALGAGFAVAPGLVVTAAHAVLDAGDVRVTLHDGREVRGEVIERSRNGLDVALVRIPAFTPGLLDLAVRPEVRTGSVVAVVGHGEGSRWSLSTGLVSNAAPAGPDAALLLLQVPLRRGASGAPVVDRSGRVVGIVAHGAPGAVAFAVRADAALRSLAGLAAIGGEPLERFAAAEGSGEIVETEIGAPLRAPELIHGPAEARAGAIRVKARDAGRRAGR